MATTAGRTSTEYDAFAPHYDAFTAGSDYETWTTHVLGLAQAHGLRGSALLDLACGTGKSFMPFAKRGFSVTGCDSSRAMLDEAERRAPEAALVHADMRELPALGRFDLITCFDDSLNYLLDEGDLARTFRGIEANLTSAGLAMFDLNTLLAYRTTFASDRVHERDGVLFAWCGQSTPDALPGCLAEARIEVFESRESGLYERVGTRHLQRHFPRKRVVALLERAGLECVGTHGVLADGALVAGADELTHLKVLYTAIRAKGGDAL